MLIDLALCLAILATSLQGLVLIAASVLLVDLQRRVQQLEEHREMTNAE